ncbi:MAG: acyl--CoA ligase [Candidatus Obscuribacterales bacterium]|nr:acyl--CoA ligase [Candidatus Obscuribacterales bacterium]
MSNRDLIQAIQNNAKRFPERVALRFGNFTVSYAELLDSATRLAAYLRAGSGFKSPVLIVLPNSIQSIEAVLACLIAGATCVPMNRVEIDAGSCSSLIEQLNPGTLIAENDIIESLKLSLQIERNLVCSPKTQSLIGSGLGDFAAGERHSLDPQDQNFALVCFSSGSTAKSKGAVHGEAELSLLARELVEKLEYDANDLSLVCMQTDRPFCLSSQIFPALLAGATLLIHSEFDPGMVLNAIQQEGITRLYLFPTMAQRLCASVLEPAETRLKGCVIGAGLCPSSTIKVFQSKFGVYPMQSMGMVETLAYSLNTSARMDKLGSCGQPLCGAEILIEDEDGSSLPAGKLGEICVTSQLQMSSYVGEECQAGTKFKTGDVGYIDEDGFLWFLCRKSTGMNFELVLESSKIQNAISAIEGVEESVVLPNREQTGLIAVVRMPAGMRQSSSSSILALRCSVPLRIIFLEQLPKLPSGKFDITEIQGL